MEKKNLKKEISKIISENNSKEDEEFFDFIIEKLKDIESISDEKQQEFLFSLTLETIERYFYLKENKISESLKELFSSILKISNSLEKIKKIVEISNASLEAINEQNKKAKENILGNNNIQKN